MYDILLILALSGKGFFATNRDNGKTNIQGKDTAGLGDDILEAEQRQRHDRRERNSSRKREQRKRKKIGEADGNNSEDDSGIVNYLDRLTNVIEKISATDDATVGKKLVKVQAAIGLQNNTDPVAAKMGTDFLMGILNAD